jgi:RNA polymerase sigma-54 factor
MLRQHLSQKMLQKLSPQQIQLMKLLQIPTASIDERIKEELEANPALDEGAESDEEQDTFEESTDSAESGEGNAEEEFEQDQQIEVDDAYINEYIEDDPISYRTERPRDNTIDSRGPAPVVFTSSFHDHLSTQLGLLDIDSERTRKVAMQILGSIDDDGYLRRKPSAIVDDLIFSQNIEATSEEVEDLLSKIQMFDPPGVGAGDLRECLLIQLKLRRDKECKESGEVNPDRELAYQILEFYFEEFSKKHYTKLQKNLEISEDELRNAIGEILKLNPKPASAYTTSGGLQFNYVVPDFMIYNRDGELDLTINNKNIPDLRINEKYVDMLRDYHQRKKLKQTNTQDKKAVLFIKQKIDSAKWFIDALRQRMQTLHRTMYAIMQFQYDYFLTGDERRIKPMILKDIAEITGLDISTVSRVANSKYVQTEFGTRKLKSFFSESVTTTSGEEVSTLEVKKTLSDIIEDENKQKPLSDEKLKNMLHDQGYNIARRTVAKYREQLGISVARLRKEL